MTKPGPKPHHRESMAIEPFKEAPPAPSYLSPDAQEVWRRYAAILVEHGMLTPPDEPALAHLSKEVALYDSLNARAERDEYVMIHSNGAPCKHPAMDPLDKCGRRIAVLLKELGMTTASRADLPPVPKPPSEKEKLAQSLFAKDRILGGFAT